MLSSLDLAALRAAFQALCDAALEGKKEALIFIGAMDLPCRSVQDTICEFDLPILAVQDYELQDTNFALALASSDAVSSLPKLRPGRPEQLEYG